MPDALQDWQAPELNALTKVLARLEGREPTKGDRLDARRIILALQDVGFDVAPRGLPQSQQEAA